MFTTGITNTVSLDNLSVISPVERHPLVPEMLEKWGQNFFFDVLRFYTICSAALFYDLQHDLLHFLVR
jgi:hypothetical protein